MAEHTRGEKVPGSRHNFVWDQCADPDCKDWIRVAHIRVDGKDIKNYCNGCRPSRKSHSDRRRGGRGISGN